MKNQMLVDDLKRGKVVTVPTETVYGYAVRLDALDGICELMDKKERGYGSGKVFTLVPASVAEISRYALVTKKAEELIRKYLPGELTLILPKNPDFHHPYYDHFATIGIRIPDHPFFAENLAEIGPMLLTSANPRGGVPKSATGHKPSTIIDCTTEVAKVLRQGDLFVEI